MLGWIKGQIVWRRDSSGVLLGLIVASLCVPNCYAQNLDRAVIVRDSAGVEIIEHDLANQNSWPSCQIASKPSVRIGTHDGDLMHELYQVEDATRLSDGRVAVVNRGSQDVRVFDSRGEFLFAIGREGSGPGEFRDPIEIAVLGPDTLVVWDWLLGRLSVFGGDGTHVRDPRPQPAVLNPTGQLEILTSDPPFVVGLHDHRFAIGTELVPHSLLLLRYDRNGKLVDTIATLPYGSKKKINDLDPYLVGSPLFESVGRFTVHGDLVFTSDGADPEIRILGPDLRLRQVVRWQPPDRTVRSTDVDEHRRIRLSRFTDESMRRRERSTFDDVPVSEHFPAVWGLKTSPNGTVWARQYPRPGTMGNTWLGFDSRARFVCALTVPSDLAVMEFGDNTLLVRSTDDLGVEYVEVYEISGPSRRPGEPPPNWRIKLSGAAGVVDMSAYRQLRW